jgi:hypothetical protein
MIRQGGRGATLPLQVSPRVFIDRSPIPDFSALVLSVSTNKASRYRVRTTMAFVFIVLPENINAYNID